MLNDRREGEATPAKAPAAELAGLDRTVALWLRRLRAD